MSLDEFELLCRKSWGKEYIYLCFDRSKTGDQGRYCIGKKSKNTYNEGIPETATF